MLDSIHCRDDDGDDDDDGNDEHDEENDFERESLLGVNVGIDPTVWVKHTPWAITVIYANAISHMS